MDRRGLMQVSQIVAKTNPELAKEMDEAVVGSDYSTYFKSKLTEFKINDVKDLSPEQWDEIDHGWKAENETD